MILLEACRVLINFPRKNNIMLSEIQYLTLVARLPGGHSMGTDDHFRLPVAHSVQSLPEADCESRLCRGVLVGRAAKHDDAVPVHFNRDILLLVSCATAAPIHLDFLASLNLFDSHLLAAAVEECEDVSTWQLAEVSSLLFDRKRDLFALNCATNGIGIVVLDAMATVLEEYKGSLPFLVVSSALLIYGV